MSAIAALDLSVKVGLPEEDYPVAPPCFAESPVNLGPVPMLCSNGSPDSCEDESSDDSGSTYARTSSPLSTRAGESGSPPPRIEPEQARAFREEYCRQVMARFGDGSSSKCFTQNAAEKVVKVLLGKEVDTKWVTRAKERGLMLGGIERPFGPEEEVTEAQEICLWKQFFGDDGSAVLDADGNIIVRKVALVEEFFDYINDLHFGDMKCVGEKSVFKRIREMCACLPRQAINMYKKLCPHCQKANRAASASKNAILIKKKKPKENEEESLFNGVSMVPMKRAYTAVPTEAEAAKVPKTETPPPPPPEPPKEPPQPVAPVAPNPDRIKAYGIFIRHMVEERLDLEQVFNAQPKDEITYILEAVGRQFPEVKPMDARGRIRGHLKSIRRSSRKNGGPSERRRSLVSMCGSRDVQEIFENAIASEQRFAQSAVEQEISSKEPESPPLQVTDSPVGKENVEPEEISVCPIQDYSGSSFESAASTERAVNIASDRDSDPDQPTDLSVRPANRDCAPSAPSEPVPLVSQQSTPVVATDFHSIQSFHDQLVASNEVLSSTVHLRDEISHMYLSSLLLPILMQQIHSSRTHCPITPQELVERWVGQVRNAAIGVLNAVECYEHYIAQYKEKNSQHIGTEYHNA